MDDFTNTLDDFMNTLDTILEKLDLKNLDLKFWTPFWTPSAKHGRMMQYMDHNLDVIYKTWTHHWTIVVKHGLLDVHGLIQGVAKKTVHFSLGKNNAIEKNCMPGFLESVYLYDKQQRYGGTGSGKYFSTYTYSNT